MSNVPYRKSTPEEEVVSGKVGIVFWSIALALCIICLITEPSYWFAIAIPSVACVGLIKVGVETKKSGEKRIAERERPQIRKSPTLADYPESGDCSPLSSQANLGTTIVKKPTSTYNSIPTAIDELLSNNPDGLKASRLAEITGFPKKDINRYLYSHKNLYIIDDAYIWTKKHFGDQ